MSTQRIRYKFSEWLEIIYIILFLAPFILLTAILIWVADFKTETRTIYIPNKIENAVRVKDARNTIIVVKYAGFGVGVGVGMGATEINCKSVKQFLMELPKDEKVYTSVEKKDEWTIMKRYLAFLPDRSGVLIYEEYINRPDIHCGLHSFNEERVVFVCKRLVLQRDKLNKLKFWNFF